jgi:hypothetical protein
MGGGWAGSSGCGDRGAVGRKATVVLGESHEGINTFVAILIDRVYRRARSGDGRWLNGA